MTPMPKYQNTQQPLNIRKLSDQEKGRQKELRDLLIETPELKILFKNFQKFLKENEKLSLELLLKKSFL